MSFDRIAPHYRWMEFVLAGGKLQRCRTAFLGEIGDAENILIVGEGNGRFLLECRGASPQARITCIDASRRMLELARVRLGRGGFTDRDVEFVQADALEWRPPARAYDLIVTHFFLDCFHARQLPEVVGKLARSAALNARWLLADFRVPAGWIAGGRGRLMLWSMYAFFRVIARLPAKRLTHPDPFLAEAGFALEQRRLSEWGLLHSDLWRNTNGLESTRHRHSKRLVERCEGAVHE